jgi:RimJ/RimL family protein N-acetyltransferase
VQGRRLPGWATGYPTTGDRQVAARVVSGTWVSTDAAHPWGPWAVVVDGTVVGGAGFHGTPDDSGTVEIGYGIAEEMRGRGIATSAVELLVDLGSSHGALRIVASTDPDNVGSQRVLENCGFSRDGNADGEITWSRVLLTQSPA